MPGEKIIISFDCANQTLGVVIAQVQPLVLCELAKISKRCAIRAMNNHVRVLFMECAYVCAASAALPTRAAALRKYLARLDEMISSTGAQLTDVILEDQTLNHISGGVMYQLAYHYAHLNVHIISPRLKNRVAFAPDLAYNIFRAKYKTRQSANKAHTRANMTAWFNIFGGGAERAYAKYGITKALEQHVADAFMQIIAARPQLFMFRLHGDSPCAPIKKAKVAFSS